MADVMEEGPTPSPEPRKWREKSSSTSISDPRASGSDYGDESPSPLYPTSDPARGVDHQHHIVSQLMLTEDDNAPDLLRQISILVHRLNDGMEVRPTDPDSMHASTRAEADRIALRREMVMHLAEWRVAKRVRRYWI